MALIAPNRIIGFQYIATLQWDNITVTLELSMGNYCNRRVKHYSAVEIIKLNFELDFKQEKTCL